MDSKAVVLYIDDEKMNLSAFEILFRKTFNVHTTIDIHKAVEIVREGKIDVIITDHMMPVMTGVELLKNIIEIDSSILRIIHSGYIDDPEIQKAAADGIAHYVLDKPLDKKLILSAIDEYKQSKK